MVERSVFGPRKYVAAVDVPIRGRPSEVDVDLFMREQLQLTSLLETRIEDDRGTFLREEITRTNFPRSALPVLTGAFMSGWGGAILTLLGQLLPYSAHYKALRRLGAEWQPADASAVDALAREAVFEGVGMYWILLNSYRHWQAEGGGDDALAPDIVKAWTRLGVRRDEFRRFRAEEYLSTAEDDAVASSESLFGVVSTQACQAGLALTLATLSDKAGAYGSAVLEMSRALVAGLNASLSGDRGDGTPRLLCLSQTVDDPINRIADMNATRAVEFRYLWLEILNTAQGLAAFSDRTQAIDAGVLGDLRDSARSRYVRQLIDERISERRRVDRRSTREAIQIPVTIEVTAGLRSALATWFGVSSQDFDDWASGAELDFSDDEPEADETVTPDDG